MAGRRGPRPALDLDRRPAALRFARRLLGCHGVGRDITLRKRAEKVLLNRNQALERLVTERTAELEQSNRDLEAFSR